MSVGFADWIVGLSGRSKNMLVEKKKKAVTRGSCSLWLMRS